VAHSAGVVENDARGIGMVIDTHVHYPDGGWPPGAPRLAAGDVVDAMDAQNIEVAWISSVGALILDAALYNENMYDDTRPYSNRFRLFASVNPNDGKRAIGKLQKFIDMGFQGVKLHPWLGGFSPFSETVYSIVELCGLHGLPVLFHDGTPPYSDTLQIAHIASLFPQTKVILGHTGLFDSMHSAVNACNEYSNIYLCISCSTLQGLRYIIKNARHDHLLYGSDFGASTDQSLIVDRLRTIELVCEDEALREKILHRNALELIK